MKTTTKFRAFAIASLAAGLMAAGQTQAAVTFITDITIPVSIPGLTNYATTGAMMDGMSVTARFSNQFSQTLPWADTSANSGGVFGTGWSLSLNGDSYSNYWDFSFTLPPTGTAGLTLIELVLNGAPGLTVFDRTFDFEEGTPGSALGWDFNLTSPDVRVTYANPVIIGATPYVGDIWQLMTVDFGSGISSNFVFGQDTDNDSRSVPEPGSLALLGAGLFGLGFLRRRKS